MHVVDPTKDPKFGYWPGSATGEVRQLKERLRVAEEEIKRLTRELGDARTQRRQVRNG